MAFLASMAAVAAAQPIATGSAPDPAVPRASAQGGGAASAGDVLARLTRKPVRLVSSGRSLAELQGSIEAALGVRLVLASNAGGLVVSGEISGGDGMAFLRELAARLRLDWAVGVDSIFVAPEGGGQSAVFPAPSSVVASRVAALANREFAEIGSGIGVTARKEEISVTGIPGWLNQVAALRVPVLIDFVQRTMAQREARRAADETADRGSRGAMPAAGLPSGKAEPLSLMVFRLSNAHVDDKRIVVGNQVLIIRGVATLFRQFTGLTGTAAETPPASRPQGISRLQRMEPVAGGRPDRRNDSGEDDSRPPQSGLAVSPDQPVVIADSRMNTLMVRDRSSMLETYRTLVKVLDQSTDMVQLDAFVIDIKASRLDEFGLGLSWAGSGSVNSSVFAPGGSSPVGANLILQAARGAQLLAQIRALQTRGDSEILMVPSVVTLNNLEATFSARQSFYVKVTGNQDASLTKVTAETLLKVTPLVARADEESANGTDRRIRLLVSVQDGTVDSSASGLVDNLPRILENQIATQAVVRGGDTLVIGGQVVRKKINNVSGLPFISSIPVLGALTSSRSEDQEQYVRIYVVRPRILGDGSAPLTEPVAADRSDPLVHRAVGRVPDLIRGAGLSPQGQDAQRPARVRGETEEVVIPVPTPEPVLPVVPVVPPSYRRDGGAGDGARKDSSSASDAGDRDGAPAAAKRAPDADDWDPDDPVWRPPGSPLGRRSAPAPRELGARADSPRGASLGADSVRVDGATQAGRDREALQILEFELRRAEREVQRLLAEPSQDSESVRDALSRARNDAQTLRNEIARMGARASARPSTTSSSPSTSPPSTEPAVAVGVPTRVPTAAPPSRAPVAAPPPPPERAAPARDQGSLPGSQGAIAVAAQPVGALRPAAKDAARVASPDPSLVATPDPSRVATPDPSLIASPDSSRVATPDPSRIAVTSGDTLYSIADRVKPDGVTVQQTMVALYRANPGAFGGSMSAMWADATLTVPNAGTIARVGLAQARDLVRADGRESAPRPSTEHASR